MARTTGTEAETDRASSLDGLLAWAAVVGPASVALWRASAAVQWQSDVAAVRDLGLSSVSMGGAVSTAMAQGLSLLPLGTVSYRHAMVSALAVAVAAGAIRSVALRLLRATGDVAPWLTSLLASVAAAMATLSPTWQDQATAGGGSAVTLALVWLGVAQLVALTSPEARTLTPEAARGWFGLAAVAGLALAEQWIAGAALVLAAVGAAFAGAKRPPWRLVPLLALVTVAVLALGWSPALLRPLAPRGLSDIGAAISTVDLDPVHVTYTDHRAAVLAWNAEVGALSIALAVVGLVTGALRSRRRAGLTALVTFVVVDLTYALAGDHMFGELLGLRASALAVICIAAAVGVTEAVAFIERMKLPFKRPAMALTVVFYVTLAAVTHEEAAYRADRSDHFAAEIWTDNALSALPPRAAVLVHSPALTWRLWAAQSLAGQRPDVLVVPAPLLRRGEVVRHLVPSEPSVSQLLQDFALHGQASEYGLSVLSDARPLLVELDPSWEQRVVDHLHVEGAWLRFEPQRLGRSERKLAAHVLHTDGLVGATLVNLDVPDPRSAQVVARTLKEHVSAMALVGMGEQTPGLIDGVERLSPHDPFVTAARLRVGHAARRRHLRHSIELRDLLRF